MFLADQNEAGLFSLPRYIAYVEDNAQQLSITVFMACGDFFYVCDVFFWLVGFLLSTCVCGFFLFGVFCFGFAFLTPIPMFFPSEFLGKWP